MDAVASVNDRADEEMGRIEESVRRVDAHQDEWATLMGMQSGRVNALAAELVDMRETMEELRRELREECQACESLQDLFAMSQLEAHMVRNSVRKLEHRSHFSLISLTMDTVIVQVLRPLFSRFHDDSRLFSLPFFLQFFLRHTLMGREKTTRRVFGPNGQQGTLR